MYKEKENLWIKGMKKRVNIKQYDEEFYGFLQEHLEKISANLKNKEAFSNLMATKMYLFDKDISRIQYKKKELNYFSELNIDPILQKNIENMEFSEMTPIQKCVLPLVIDDINIIGCAQTGSGKTVAFLLPILQKLLDSGPPNYSGLTALAKPSVLILSPTRELTEQTYKVCRLLSYGTGITCVKLYGGVPHIHQINEMKGGGDIVIATPGRLIDYLKKGTIDLAFTRFLILDEADRMLDMGFEKQMNEIVFLYNMPNENHRQSLLFSATFDKEIIRTSNSYIKNYIIASSSANLTEQKANENIDQQFILVDEKSKMFKLHEILQTIKGSALVFLERKHSVDALHYQFQQAGYNCVSIHGDKSQDDRDYAIEQFKSGKIPILMATDVVGRGLDFPNVKYVFNYDSPKTAEDYIHRIGRTGRCGSTGTAVTFLTDENGGLVKQLIPLLKQQNISIPDFFYSMSESKSSFSYSNNRGGNYRRNNDNYGSKGGWGSNTKSSW